MKPMLLSLAILALGACAGAETPRPMPQTQAEATAQDTCGASRYRHLIGAPMAAVDRDTLPPGARLITPETMVTQDFAPGRLNIMSSADGRVSSLACF